jgi:hypothetical protein
MMEKGSFHPSPTLSTDELVKNVPLPNQLPKGIDFKELPSAAFKSATLEALISQNEDLMARLSVSLRKGSQLEERVGALEQDNAMYRQKHESLREKYLVLQEKDRLAGGRDLNLLAEVGTYKTQFRRLEKIYSELFVQAQGLQRRLARLERYRAAIRKAAPGLQKAAKFSKTRADEYLQLSISHQQSVTSYEAKLAEVREQITLLRCKADERDLLFEDKLQLSNQVLHVQRQTQIFREETERQMLHYQSENSALRLQAKDQALTNHANDQELAKLRNDTGMLQEENAALRNQVESLQVLWAHRQKDFEAGEQKNRSLQKLNQTLSQSLNQQRKEQQDLQGEVEKERYWAQEQIRTLTAELQLLRRGE